MKTTSLKLYHLSWCSYCWRVRAAADALGIPLELIDIDASPTSRSYLIEARGRPTTPVLGIVTGNEEELLGESQDIIEYLKKKAEAPSSLSGSSDR